MGIPARFLAPDSAPSFFQEKTGIILIILIAFLVTIGNILWWGKNLLWHTFLKQRKVKLRNFSEDLMNREREMELERKDWQERVDSLDKELQALVVLLEELTKVHLEANENDVNEVIDLLSKFENLEVGERHVASLMVHLKHVRDEGINHLIRPQAE